MVPLASDGSGSFKSQGLTLRSSGTVQASLPSALWGAPASAVDVTQRRDVARIGLRLRIWIHHRV
jgi:hypothetical protein